jgi:hypothetical protein
MSDFQKVTLRCSEGHIFSDWEGPAGEGLKKVVPSPCPICNKPREEVKREDIEGPET